MQRRPDIDAAVADVVAAVPAGAGRVLVVVGERGRGRTHAARAAARHAALAGLRVLALHPGDTPLDVPFAAVERLLQDAGGLPDAGAPAPDATVQAVHRLVRRLAGERPLALVVDDLDALDAASVRCVEHLAAAAADLALLVVVTLARHGRGRAGELRTRLAGLPAATVVSLPPLGPDDVGVLMAGRGVAGDAVQRARLAAASGGDAALAAAVLDAGAGPSRTDSPVARDACAGVIAARVQRLGPAAADVLDAAVVLGEDATLARVARVAGVAQDAARAAVDGLRAAALLASGEPLRPACPLVAAALADGPVSGRAPELRARAAAVLRDESAPLARVADLVHATQAGAVAGARKLLEAAAAQARRAGRLEDAERHLRRALAEPGGAGAGRRLLATQVALGRDGAAERLEAELLGCEPGRRAELAGDLVDALLAAGRRRAAAEVLRRELGQAGTAAAGLEDAFVAVARDLPGLADDARERLAARAAGPLSGRAAVAAAVDAAFAGDRRERTAALAQEALQAVLRDGAPGEEAARCVAVLLWCDELEAARAAAQRLRLNGVVDPGLLAPAEAWMLLVQGRLPEALEAATHAGAAALPGSAAAAAAAATAVQADVRLAAGDPEGAAAIVRRAALGRREERGFDVHLLDARGRLELQRGDDEPAAATFALAVDLGLATRMDNPAVVRAWFGRGWALQRLGRIEEAREQAGEALRRSERFGAPRAVAAALRLHAAVAPELDAAVAALERAVELLGAAGAALERARALVDHGAALSRVGRRDEGRERLREALDLAHGMGAAALERRARRALRGAGARPRRPQLSGVAALTPAERQIADHAGRGLSNREIAEVLFVTTKTVEWHLRNVYAKLGIADRRGLAGALAGRPAGGRA